MKRTLAMILTLAMLFSMVFSLGTVASAGSVTTKPFYGLGWSAIDRAKFSNLDDAPVITVRSSNGVVSLYSSSSDPATIAKNIKAKVDLMPEGMRYVRIWATSNALSAAPENVVYLDAGVDQLKALFTEFIKAYYALGGKLDGVILDTEYHMLGNWYIYSKEYYQNNKITNQQIYNQIVANPKYQTEIRPMLVERGFTFWENPSGYKSEIYSIWPYQYLSSANQVKYANSASIWNTVMKIRMSQYFNESIYEPMRTYYPDGVLSDYQVTDSYSWLKDLSDTGSKNYLGGNSMKIGNASNYNTYSSRPSSTFYVDASGNYLYQNPAAYNKAEYEDDAYNMFLWDINKFKKMYAATDTKKITAWIAEYDYGTRAGSVSNTAYYTETILHLGLLNPEPFLVYIYSGASKFKGTNGTNEYNKRMQVISEILNELTRVVGYSDRKPIETPASWNDGFVLSGMYANGRNVWRLTPDTTDGMTLAAFKIKDKDPTFSINGTTITFPGGKIIADGEVSVVGTGGYWIETSAGTNPVIATDADRYSKYPSYEEKFDSYTAGTGFTSATAALPQTWSVSANNLLIQAQADGNALALTGTATLNNMKLPKNITAGDSYAKQQAWEISFTLSSALNSGANVKLLTCSGDGGIKLENDKVYYDSNRSYKELTGVTLTAGQKYTVKREVNFTTAGGYTCTYCVYNDSGKLLAQAANVPMSSNTVVPVPTISMSCSNLTTTVLVDDYKLYPTGLAQDLEIYNAKTGMPLDVAAKADAASVAYRLSWMNATQNGEKMKVMVARYNSSGALLSKETVKTVELAPGADGVVTGIVQNSANGKVLVYLENTIVDTPNTTPTTTPTTMPTVETTTAPTVGTTAPTAGTTAPTAGTTAPTAGTTVPTAGTTVPTAGTTAPTAGTTAPTAGTTAPTAGTTAPTVGTTTPTAGITTAPTEGTNVTPTIEPTAESVTVSTVLPTQPVNPPAGNRGRIILWICLPLVPIAAMVCVLIIRKKHTK